MNDENRPRTHRWYKNQRPGGRREPEPERLRVRVPQGKVEDPARVAEATREALKGWPVVVLKLVGTPDESFRIGRHPGRWLRKYIGHCIDSELCSCQGPRCILPECKAHRLIGRHAVSTKPDGEAWAPWVIRAAGTATGSIKKGQPIRCELVFAGAESVAVLPDFLRMLRGQPQAPPREPNVDWGTIQNLVLDADGEGRWRKSEPESIASALLPLERLTEPALRPRRLVVTFLSTTPLGRREETGIPSGNLPLFIDRVGRSMGAWMGRTSHRGPRLPIDDLLRCASEATLVADNTNLVRVTSALLGAAGSQTADGPIDVPALLGSMTFKGDLSGLAPLLRAASYLGLGPGRQHGLGQIALR
ncbi:MAG: hypothetical protein CMP23_04125 [Rickettsiales bacterium]|nr:hypothetical protein [Rickettsiales bacterium]|tara:strand:- start:2243 stop:3325 length:1083 start_codon:yes stop_codon:yes gene_type:complete